MNKIEAQQVINSIQGMVSELRSTKESFDKKSQELEQKIETKIKAAPANLESEILRSAQESLSASIKSVLTGYGSPLTKLVEQCVNNENAFLKELIKDSFGGVIRTQEFKNSLISAFSHKVSRAIIAGDDSLFQKCCNDLKQDPVFKSKMTLALSNVVEECISCKQEK